MNRGNSDLDKKMAKIVGLKLRSLRIYKGYSLQYVADRILPSKNRGTINHWESGRAQPSLAQLKKACDLFGVDVLEFLGEVYDEIF